MTEPTTDTATGLVGQLRAIVHGVLGDGPAFLVDLTVRGGSGSHVVEVFVDSDETLDVDALTRISRELRFLLDAEDLVSGPYRLDVSTPGVDRPLRLPRQYVRNVGRQMRVVLHTEDETVRELVGTLVGASADDIVIRQGDGAETTVDFPSIKEAKVLLPW